MCEFDDEVVLKTRLLAHLPPQLERGEVNLLELQVVLHLDVGLWFGIFVAVMDLLHGRG